MTAGLYRFQSQGHHHFLTFSCDQRAKYFASDRAKDVFEAALERTRQKYGFYIMAYVVMPEHIHMLVTEPPTVKLSVAMKSLKLSVSKLLPEKPFWLPRYFDVNIYSEKYWLNAIHYIHRNPVKRGLVAKPEDWRWSSAQTFLTFECGVVRLESFYAASQNPHIRDKKAVDGQQPAEPT